MLNEIMFQLDDRSGWTNTLFRLAFLLIAIVPTTYFHYTYLPKVSIQVSAIKKDTEKTKNTINANKKEHMYALERFISESELTNISKAEDITSKALSSTSNIQLMALEESLPQLLTDKSLIKYSLNKSSFIKTNIDIKARARYTAAYEFLSSLEKTSVHLYWDSINYNVYDYPNAVMELRYFIIDKEGNR